MFHRSWQTSAAPNLMLYFLDSTKLVGEWAGWLGSQNSREAATSGAFDILMTSRTTAMLAR